LNREQAALMQFSGVKVFLFRKVVRSSVLINQHKRLMEQKQYQQYQSVIRPFPLRASPQSCPASVRPSSSQRPLADHRTRSCYRSTASAERAEED